MAGRGKGMDKYNIPSQTHTLSLSHSPSLSHFNHCCIEHISPLTLPSAERTLTPSMLVIMHTGSWQLDGC